MKRRIIKLFPLVFTIFALSGCNKEEVEQTTTHHYTENYLFDKTKHWKECTDENCEQQVNVAIHEFLDWRVIEDSTCSKEGIEESKCSVCDYVLRRAIPLKDHNVGSTWRTNEEYHWLDCTNDPQEKVEYNRHSFKWVYSTEPTCTTGGRGYQECQICKYKLPTVDVEPLGHSWVIDEDNTTYATCDTDGVVVHKCSVCQAVETTNVTAGHNWLEPVYTWNDTYTKVTATRVCGNNPDHIESETVNATLHKVAPTCSAKGSLTYTSENFQNSGFEQQVKVIELEKCSDTLEHFCEAEKYTGGEIYDKCTICQTKYNVRSVSQPWEVLDLENDPDYTENPDNGGGEVSTYNPSTKALDLKYTKTQGASYSFLFNEPIEKSLNKKYFVMDFTLLDKVNSWYDIYLTVSGLGNNILVRFGTITSVQASGLDKASFYMNGKEVAYNSINQVGLRGQVYVDISSITNGVTMVKLASDGGCKIQINGTEFRSSKCDHDLSCYSSFSGTTCGGLIFTECDVCNECGFEDNLHTSGLPEGYTELDLNSYTNIRWDPIAYDTATHTITAPNTYHPGPLFEKPNATKMIVDMNVTWDDGVVGSSSNAKFEIFFMNHELADKYPADNMNTHRYYVGCAPTGIVGSSEGIDNPASVDTIAKYLDYNSGDVVSTYEKNERIVLEVNLANSTISDFAIMLFAASNGTSVQLNNVIYC